MTRQDMMSWERQMRNYFKASNFDICPNDVQVCYLEERMDEASSQYLRKLCYGTPETYGMENLYRMIREYVIRTESLQQRRIIGMLNFRQRPNESFSQALCRFDEEEKDCNVESYTVDEMRAHLRVAGCKDSKLKEELLKIGQSEDSNEQAEPLTATAIWHATRNYEQRQQCLRSETDEIAVSSVSSPKPKPKSCKTNEPQQVEESLLRLLPGAQVRHQRHALQSVGLPQRLRKSQHLSTQIPRQARKELPCQPSGPPAQPRKRGIFQGAQRFTQTREPVPS